MRAEHDPLASHIFVSRRHYQNLSDTKSGKRRAMSTELRGEETTRFKLPLSRSEFVLGPKLRQLQVACS